MNARTAADVIYDALSGKFGDFCGGHADAALDALRAEGWEVVKANPERGVTYTTEAGNPIESAELRTMAAGMLHQANKQDEELNDD